MLTMIMTELKRIREKQLMTQEVLGAKCGLPQETLSRYENGKPAKFTLVKEIADTLRVSIYELCPTVESDDVIQKGAEFGIQVVAGFEGPGKLCFAKSESDVLQGIERMLESYEHQRANTVARIWRKFAPKFTLGLVKKQLQGHIVELFRICPRSVMFATVDDTRVGLVFATPILSAVRNELRFEKRDHISVGRDDIPEDLKSNQILFNGGMYSPLNDFGLCSISRAILETVFYQVSNFIEDAWEDDLSLITQCGTPENEKRLTAYGFEMVAKCTPKIPVPVFEWTPTESKDDHCVRMMLQSMKKRFHSTKDGQSV